MSQKDKLIQRIKSKPKDLTFEEIETLLNYFNYMRFDKGHTSGSRVIFTSESHPPIMLHKPHSRKTLLDYQVKQIIKLLEQEDLI